VIDEDAAARVRERAERRARRELDGFEQARRCASLAIGNTTTPLGSEAAVFTSSGQAGSSESSSA